MNLHRKRIPAGRTTILFGVGVILLNTLVNAFSDIKSPDEQAALLKKLGSDGICTRPQNATPEFFATMDNPHISPPSSLRRGYDRQAGPTQWLFQPEFLS